jgi:hypothetical protein
MPCENPDPIISPDTTGNSSVVGFSHPFYASISPQIFALATATVISYILVILIFITPRTFYLGGPGGGGRFLSRRGIIPGSYGSSSVVGIGRRPLLQKIAAVTVAISLTIATADTFNVAEDQYNQGYIDSSQLVDSVVDSLEIRIIRVISDTFLWLAQVQTLIRLFPRHKEKVTIKWLGFAMVSFDTIFSILDSFVSESPRTRPRSFSDAIPALNYLFELAISLIYASCVVYYCLSKRRFAFWHPKMKNICLVALLSLISVVIPVVFFILDISQPDLAGWGEYIRWVGAAAASVVVWEWVERIESLERDERKDGILGREIFDGDEMLNMTPSEDASWRGDLGSTHGGGDGKGMTVGMVSSYRRLRVKIPLRKRRKRAPPDGIATGTDALDAAGRPITDQHFVVPQQIMTPPNRSDTGSASSTVYAVRYHNLTSPSPNPQPELRPETDTTAGLDALKDSDSASSPSDADKDSAVPVVNRTSATVHGRNLWQAMQNPFKRRRSEPPVEVADAQNATGVRRSPTDRNLNLRDRLGAFASAQKERFASRNQAMAVTLPVTVIPAPKNNERTWSPDDVQDHAPPEEYGGMESSRPGHSSWGDEVVLIPAPVNGRTWSPEDANPSPVSYPDSRRPDTAATQRSASTPGQIQIPQQVYYPRGSLMISENDPRPARLMDMGHPASPRSPTYARPPGVASIAEDVTNEVGGEEATTSVLGSSPTPLPVSRSPMQDSQAGAEDSAESGPATGPTSTTRTTGLGPGQPSQSLDQGSSTAGTPVTDGRNTGGGTDQ